MYYKLIPMLALLLSLSACSGDEKPAEKPKSPWDAQIKAMEKAKQVDQLIQDSAEKRREEMEKQGL